jgi:hypothetical protein
MIQTCKPDQDSQPPPLPSQPDTARIFEHSKKDYERAAPASTGLLANCIDPVRQDAMDTGCDFDVALLGRTIADRAT